MGSLENEIHNNNELEGEITPEDIVPIGNILDDDIVQYVQEAKDNVALDKGLRIEKSYSARLRKMLRKYRK